MMGKLKQHLYGTADDIKDLHEGPQLRSKLISDRNGRDMRDVLALMSGHVNNREGSLHRISQRGHGIHSICLLGCKEEGVNMKIWSGRTLHTGYLGVLLFANHKSKKLSFGRIDSFPVTDNVRTKDHLFAIAISTHFTTPPFCFCLAAVIALM